MAENQDQQQPQQDDQQSVEEGKAPAETSPEARAAQESLERVQGELDHSEDEVVESQDPDQQQYNATTTIHRAEIPEGAEATSSADYRLQQQNAPQPGLQQEVKPEIVESGDAGNNAEGADNE